MNDKQRTSPLGRGLSALFGDSDQAYGVPREAAPAKDNNRGPRLVPVELLVPSTLQPRRDFDETHLRTLADSIRERGVLQPILVRRHVTNPDAFEIVAGERRWRAAQMAALHEVPVIVRDLDDRETLEVAIIENVQRQDLNPIEEAISYKRLIDEFSHTQEQIAKVIGKSRSHIANILRLLQLPKNVQDRIQKGELSMGHARALLSVKDPESVARAIVERGLTVRKIEQIAQEEAGRSKPIQLQPGKATAGKASAPTVDVDTLALEREITDWLGLKVTIRPAQEGGTLSIEYKTLDQLEDVLQRLATNPATGERAAAVA